MPQGVQQDAAAVAVGCGCTNCSNDNHKEEEVIESDLTKVVIGEEISVDKVKTETWMTLWMGYSAKKKEYRYRQKTCVTESDVMQ